MCAMLESAGSFPNEGETEAWLAKKVPRRATRGRNLEDDLEGEKKRMAPRTSGTRSG